MSDSYKAQRARLGKMRRSRRTPSHVDGPTASTTAKRPTRQSKGRVRVPRSSPLRAHRVRDGGFESSLNSVRSFKKRVVSAAKKEGAFESF